jgi:protein ImuA
MRLQSRDNIFKTLQHDILRLEGFRSLNNAALDISLGPIAAAFPSRSFPLGAIHEFISDQNENTASTSGFISGVLSTLMGRSGATLWISAARKIFPPALKSFGLEPDQFIFLDVKKEKEILWVMEEALKCSALSAVVGEMNVIDFTSSRRLQLAVEQSEGTGFIIRKNLKKITTTACLSRWKITSLASIPIEGTLPGIGFPQWKVELLRMRNGKSGSWNVQWANGRFEEVSFVQVSSAMPEQKKAG